MSAQKEYQIICDNIRFLRQLHGLSRSAMARKLRITLKTLDSLEAGVFPDRIRIGFLFQIWQEFGIPQKDMVSIRLADKAAPTPGTEK